MRVALGLVGLALVACVVALVVLGLRGDRIDGADLEAEIKRQLISMGAAPAQVDTIRCPRSKLYGDGDTVECIGDDANGDSVTLVVRVFEEDEGWRVQLDVGE